MFKMRHWAIVCCDSFMIDSSLVDQKYKKITLHIEYSNEFTVLNASAISMVTRAMWTASESIKHIRTTSKGHNKTYNAYDCFMN